MAMNQTTFILAKRTHSLTFFHCLFFESSSYQIRFLSLVLNIEKDGIRRAVLLNGSYDPQDQKNDGAIDRNDSGLQRA